MMDKRVGFTSDYMEGAHPAILRRLAETNMVQAAGYGLDAFSESARAKIRAACGAPDAEIHFLTGGTQTNMTVISAMLRPYQGVVAAETGHIALHEAGAIERGGHKVLALPAVDGKLTAEAVAACLNAYADDENHDHMVMPGMVYITHPTECGTLYTRAELSAISAVCRSHRVPLFLDGARLAYALGCDANDVTLEGIARLTDVFYIGGTKCGALLGEAVVFPEPCTVPHFFSIVKQCGALLAKGRLLGIQFDALFTDGLYARCGAHAIAAADRIRAALRERGYRYAWETPTNQIFLALSPAERARLERYVRIDFWEKISDETTVMRIATSWATRAQDVDRLIAAL